MKLTPNLYKFVLNGVDVTSYVYRMPRLKRANEQPVKSGSFTVKISVNNVLVVNDSIIGDDVTIQRGFSTSTERYIFRGEVVSYKKIGSLYEFAISDKLYACSRREYDYTFDIDIDLEAGVGSEIVKALLDVPGLSYDSTSIVSTGTDSSLTFNMYPVKGKIINSIKNLAKTYKYQVFYDSDDDLVYFVPEGHISTSTILTTGSEIVGRIIWNNTGEDMANNITLIGGSQLDWNSESFNGDGSTVEFVLGAKPVDTLISVGGVDLNRGVNSSDPNDFYVKSESKTVVFSGPPSSGAGNVVVKYSYNVPVKVTNSDYVSIGKYNQRDVTIVDDKLTNSDDAEIKSRTLISKNSVVLTSAPIKVIGNNDLEIGQQIRVVDSVNKVTKDVVVKSINYSYPYKFDRLDVGKMPVDFDDFLIDQASSISDIKRELASDSDINVQIINNQKELFVSGYTVVSSAGMDSGVLYWDSSSQGDWDSFNWGSDTEETYSVSSMIPVNMVVFEDFRSDEFKSGSTTATWSNTGSVSFSSGQVAQSEYYLKDSGTTVSTATLSVSYTGSLLFELSSDGSNWETVSSGVSHTFSNTGNYLYWRATENASGTASLSSVKVVING